MLLRVYTLLKDKIMEPAQVTNLLKTCKTDNEFEEAVREKVSNYDEFLESRAHYGFNTNNKEIWRDMISTYFTGDVIKGVVNKLNKVSQTQISNSSTALAKLINTVADKLAESKVSAGLDLQGAIKYISQEQFNNNRDLYIREFNARTTDSTISDVVNHEVNAYREVPEESDWKEILGRVSPLTVKTILQDIYETRSLYFLNPDSGGTVYYSMWESFLRVVANLDLMKTVEISGLSNDIDKFNVEYRSESKFKNYDEIMEYLARTYLIKGISPENLNEFHVYLMKVNLRYNRTNVAPMVQVEELNPNSPTSAIGNYGNRTTLKGDPYSETKSDSAKKFDIISRACYAISKLYRYLVDAGVSPFKVHPKLFTANFDNPSDKFTSLVDLVLYSGDYVEAIMKYGYTKPIANYNAVADKDTGIPLLSEESSKIVLANRQEIKIDALSGYIGCLVDDGRNENYAVVQLEDIGYVVNLFTFARYMIQGYNPLLALYKGDNSIDDWTSYIETYDIEEVYDPEALGDILETVLNIPLEDALDYSEHTLDYDSLAKVRELATGQLRDLLDDVFRNDVEKEINILCAIQEFVEDFSEEINRYNKIFHGAIISSVEYSNYLLKLDLLKGIHDIITGDMDPRNNEESEKKFYEASTAIFKQYYPELTEEMFRDFITTPVKTIAYNSLLAQLHSVTLKGILTQFRVAKANLFNLGKYGESIAKITERDITAIIANLPPRDETERDEFLDYIKGVSKNKEGYLINETGYYFDVYDNPEKLIQAPLHSSGYYVLANNELRWWKEFKERNR